MLKSNFDPTNKHLAQIENWLIDEWNNTRKGFYSNWNMIADAFEKNRMSVITVNNYAIGFATYTVSEFTIDIDISEIKYTERKKGVATRLINDTLDNFKANGILVARLYCQPENSEIFWKKIGFKNFPKFIDDTEIYLFKPLVETLQPSVISNKKSTIKLWNCEPHQSDKINANWNWDLNFESDNKTLSKPIIFPASRDWLVSVILNGEEINSDKVKYLGIDLCDYPGFMIIRKITS